MFQFSFVVWMCRRQFVHSKMEKEYSIKVLIECAVVVYSLYSMCNEFSAKSGETVYELVVKSICSVRKFQTQFDNIQSIRMTSDVHRLQSLFTLIMKNFIANSLNLDTFIMRLAKRKWIITKRKWKRIQI